MEPESETLKPTVEVEGGIPITDLTPEEADTLTRLPLGRFFNFRENRRVMAAMSESGERTLYDVTANFLPAKAVVPMPPNWGGQPGLPDIGELVRVWKGDHEELALVIAVDENHGYDAAYDLIEPNKWAYPEALSDYWTKPATVMVFEGKAAFDFADGIAGMSVDLECYSHTTEMWVKIQSYVDSNVSSDPGCANFHAYRMMGKRVRCTLEILEDEE